MIDLHYWTTPNGHKATIFLEELGLPYNLHPVNISKNEQFKAEFLKVAPNNKIPANIDNEPEDGKVWGAAGEYMIADMAIYPWVVPHKMQKREAVVRAYNIAKKIQEAL